MKMISKNWKSAVKFQVKNDKIKKKNREAAIEMYFKNRYSFYS